MGKSLPIVAIVGRANVGKSSLFNAVLGRRETIVAKEAGTTRDSIFAVANYLDKNFWLIDTAGAKTPEDDFELTIQEQITEAIASSDIIWLVIEANTVITDEDRKVAKLALKSKKPVILVVNKADKAKNASYIDFLKLGVKSIVLTSAEHKTGLGDLLESTTAQIPKVKAPKKTDAVTIALLGRPNVGKSSLFNTLAKKQQAVVADKSGTTRDLNRVTVKYEKRSINLIDTAGIRRSGRIERGVEHFSVLRTLSAIEQANICLLLIDANESRVQLDQKIAGMVKESCKGLVLVVTKWDTLEDKDPKIGDTYISQLRADFPFVPWAPLIFTSAETGLNVAKIFELAITIQDSRRRRIETKVLNRWLQKVIVQHPPAGLKNRQPKLNYMVQEDDSTNFKIFGSKTKFLHWSYKRYIERKFREEFEFKGTALKFWFIEKHVTQ